MGKSNKETKQKGYDYTSYLLYNGPNTLSCKETFFILANSQFFFNVGIYSYNKTVFKNSKQIYYAQKSCEKICKFFQWSKKL